MLRMLLKYFINVNDFVLVVELSISYVYITVYVWWELVHPNGEHCVFSGELCVFSGELCVYSGGFRIRSSQR